MDHELLIDLEKKISDGRDLMKILKTLPEKIHGVDKLSRKINQEVKFLMKVQSTGRIKKEYLQSTNLIHLNAMVQRLLSAKEPIAVLKPFRIDNARLEVDVVCQSGATWVKVIARNARALTLISLGNGEFGQKSALDQAQVYLRCATKHPHCFKAPEVIFHFACGIETQLAVRLEKLGVLIEGERIDCENVATNDTLEINTWSDDSDVDEMYFDDMQSKKITLESLNHTKNTEIKSLNLDVSTLLAYVSNMTNGMADFIYLEPLLTLQAEWERARPVKPILDKLLDDKELYVCRTAYDNFMDIIRVIGGPNETRRACELMERVEIIDDAVNGRILQLNLGGKIKKRSRLVFATGEAAKSITVSANEGFVRAARMQGIECTVVLHEPRSLSEIKEQTARRIEMPS